MNDRRIHKLVTYAIAAVWMVNGLFCKVLGFVPRHEQIVSRILGNTYSVFLTKTIGFAEIFMAIWIASGIKKRLHTITQITVVAAMNIVECIFVPDLLLWGEANIVFASIFIFVVYYNEYVLNKKIAQ